MHPLRLPLGGGASESLNPEGAEKIGSGGGACPPELVNRDAFSNRTSPGGGGAMPLEDDYVRQHVEGFCGSELFDVIQMHLRRRGVI